MVNTEAKSAIRARQCCAFVAALGCGIGLIGTAVAEDNGWYTEAQATRGHQLFNNYCAQCHRPDLSGAVGPALVGDAFLGKWSNKPLGELFNFEHSSMPANNPGSLPDETTWMITAYILQKNSFPAGSTELGPATGQSRVLAAK